MKRLFAILGLAASLLAGSAFVGAAPASAHPLGNFTVNRYSGIVLSPRQVRILYVVDMAEIPTFQAMPSIDTNGEGTADPSERQAWADRTAPTLLANLFLLWQCIRLYRQMEAKAARRVMFSSYIYLPVVLLAYLADKL